MRQRILARLKEAATQSACRQRPVARSARTSRRKSRSARLTPSVCRFCGNFRSKPISEPGFAMADETETPRYVQQALDNALRIFRGVAREQEAIALVFAQIPENRIRQGLEALLNRRWSRPRRSPDSSNGVPRGLDRRGCRASRHPARLKLSLESVEGGLDAFLASGPGGSSPIRYSAAGCPPHGGRPGCVELFLMRDGFARGLYRVRQHFFNKDRKPRKQLTPHYLEVIISDRTAIIVITWLASARCAAPRRGHQSVPAGSQRRAVTRRVADVPDCQIRGPQDAGKRTRHWTSPKCSSGRFRLLQQMDEFASKVVIDLETRYHRRCSSTSSRIRAASSGT